MKCVPWCALPNGHPGSCPPKPRTWNVAETGRVKGSGGRYRIHKWLPEGDYLVQGCMTGSAIEPGLLVHERPSATHPRCATCFNLEKPQ